MLREKLKGRVLRPLFLLAALFALSQSASAWSYYYLTGNDGSGAKRMELKWSDATQQCDGTFTITSDWTGHVTATDQANTDNSVHGPASAVTVQNSTTATNLDLQNMGQNITLKPGTYKATLKLEGDNKGYNPASISFVKADASSTTYNWYLRGSWGTDNAGWNEKGQKAFTNNNLTFTDYRSYSFKLFDGTNWYGDIKYYNTAVIEADGNSGNFKLKNNPPAGTTVYFTLTTKDGHAYLSATTTAADKDYKVFINYQPSEGDDDWANSATQTCESGKSYTFTVNMDHNSHFGVKVGDNATFYGPSGSNHIELAPGGTTSSIKASSTYHYVWTGGAGVVNIKVTLGANGVPSKIEVTGPAYNGGGDLEVPSTGTYLYGGFAGDDYELIELGTDTDNDLTYTLMNHASKAEPFYYVIYKDGVRYGVASTKKQDTSDWSYKNAVSLTQSSKTSGDYWYLNIPAKSQVVLNYRNGEFGFNDNLNGFSGKLGNAVWFTDLAEITVDPERAGQVYLLAKQLNGELESPEWLMEEVGQGEYVLRNFAMRPKSSSGDQIQASIPFIRYYDDEGVPHEVTYAGKALPADNIDMSPGWAFNANFRLADKEFTLSTVHGGAADQTSQDILPYIGILGEKFVQVNEFKTPLEYTGRMGNTSLGWQEAYIQYDAQGAPVTDADGTAYYNTCWPPRNNILMQANIGENVDPLKTSVSALTFNLDEAGPLTGETWSEQLSGAEYADLKLEDKTRYVRYTVPNMWMLGAFKIWTGWAGYQATWGAQWNSHLYWGPTTDSDVQTNVTYSPSNSTSSKNFRTPGEGTERMFAKTMELFIPVTVKEENDEIKITGYDFTATKLYMTDATGDAKIDSKSHNRKAGYMPSLGTFPSGYKLTGYTVTRHKYDANEEAGTYAPCDKSGRTEDLEESAVITTVSGISYANAEEFAKDFEADNSEYFAGQYVNDGVYAPGLYIYSFDVVFTSEVDPNDRRTDKVWSPYIQILDDNYTLTVNPVQLIELADANREGEYGDYNYISYNSSMNGMLLKVEADGKVTKAARIRDIEGTANYARRCAEIYEQLGKWTNKVIMAVTKPTLFTQQGGKDSDITLFNATRMNGEVVADFMGVTPIGGTYYRVFDQGMTLKPEDFKANFKANFTTNAGEQEVDLSPVATYRPRFMLPGLGTADFDFRQTDEPMDFSMTHEAMDDEFEGKATTIGNSLNFDIPIAMPRVAHLEYDGKFLDQQVYKSLSMQLGRSVSAGGWATEKLIAHPSDEATVLHYDAQSPYDWMQAFKRGGSNDLTDRYWEGLPREFTLKGTKFAATDDVNITGVDPKLSATDMTVLLHVSFYTPKTTDHQYMKVIVPVEGEENQFVCKVYLKALKFHPEMGTDTEIGVGEEGSFTMPEIASETNPIYVVMVQDNNDPDEKFIPTTLLEFDAAQDKDDLYLLYTSAPFHWYAEMYQYTPELTMYISRAYPFYAANDDDTRYSGFSGALLNWHPDYAQGKGLIENSKLAIRYDQKDEEIDVTLPTDPETPAAAPRRADSNNDGDEVFEPGDEAIHIDPEAGDNAFLFAPRYQEVDVNAGNIMTSVDFIDANEAGVEVGAGFIDAHGNFAMIFDAAGKMVYTGEGRVEVPAGVYVVNIARGAMKVIVR